MKNFLWLFLLLTAFTSGAFAPPIDFIVGEIEKRCIDGNVRMTGMLKEKDEVSFLDLSLSKDGLVATKKTPVKASDEKSLLMAGKINLYVLSELVKCEAQGGKKIKAYLVLQGIDVNKISHGLNEEDPVFIIGADAADKDSPQLWIDKQTFMPVKEKTSAYEVMFMHWAKLNMPAEKIWPRTMRTIHNDKREIKLDMAEAYEPKAKRN